MKEMFVLFVLLSAGYLLCVVAKKEKGVLRTLGYTLGISILVLSLASAFISSYMKHCEMWKMGGLYGSKAMRCHMMKK